MKGNSLRRNTAFNLNQAQFFKPQTRMEANRWLAKACIGGGATPAVDLTQSTKDSFVAVAGSTDDASDLMDIGYAAWLDNQFYDVELFDIPLVDDPLYIEPDEDVIGLTFGTGTGDAVYTKWFEALALYGKTSVRLKMVYALSQIFAVRAQGNERGFMSSHVQSIYDCTKQNNVSTFRQLLKEMTYSPVMSYWLTYENNRKADPAINRLPDENYAREVMQLFSIGVVCLNMDGTPMLDSEGNEIPTYTALDVKECAKFMTGLFNPDFSVHRFLRYSDQHETASKKLFAYPGGSEVVLPAQTSYLGLDHWMPAAGYTITVTGASTFTVAFTEPKGFAATNAPLRYRTVNSPTAAFVDATVSWANGGTLATVTKTSHGLSTGDTLYIKHHVEDSIDAFLDHLFNHPSCPPFIAKALIKFFVTSNPSPGYVERVAKVFVNNGLGVRGQLAYVVRAILLDREAIIPYDADPSYRGRHLTYFERLYKVLRGMRTDLVHMSSRTGFNFKTMQTIWSQPRTTQDYSALSLNSYYGMNTPFSPPSVFNFFRPGYIPPASDLATSKLTGPEIQINTPEAQTVWQNVVCGALNYISLGFNYGPFDNFFPYSRDSLLDPRGSIGPNVGFDFEPHPDGFTITGKTADSIIIQGIITGSCKAPSYVSRVWIYNRTKAEYKFGNIESASGFINGGRPAATGLQTFNIFVDWNGGTGQYDIGDVLDFHPAVYLPHGGFTGHSNLTGGGEPGSRQWATHIPLLYTFCLNVSDAETLGDSDADILIDYLQDIYMGRPISTELRTIMRDLIKLPVTVPDKYEGIQDSNSAAVTSNWRNFFYDRRQIRVRRALAALFVSPEFSIVD